MSIVYSHNWDSVLCAVRAETEETVEHPARWW